jgi:hypothetical protein
MEHMLYTTYYFILLTRRGHKKMANRIRTLLLTTGLRLPRTR